MAMAYTVGISGGHFNRLSRWAYLLAAVPGKHSAYIAAQLVASGKSGFPADARFASSGYGSIPQVVFKNRPSHLNGCSRRFFQLSFSVQRIDLLGGICATDYRPCSDFDSPCQHFGGQIPRAGCPICKVRLEVCPEVENLSGNFKYFVVSITKLLRYF